ncbi:hypothetical protein C4K15_2202 [Pseudomonas chlororaphis subsp. aurantiaca]|nr:hypothetical protein C4K15_2202 [Pseudomonas chlororaphis subsp. aurantiaca]
MAQLRRFSGPAQALIAPCPGLLRRVWNAGSAVYSPRYLCRRPGAKPDVPARQQTDTGSVGRKFSLRKNTTTVEWVLALRLADKGVIACCC